MKSRLSVLASTQTSPSRVLLRDLFPALSLHLVNLCADYTFHQDYWQGQRHRNIKCCLCHGVLQRRKTMDADRRSVDTCSHVIWNTVKLFECYFLSYLMAKLALNFLGVMMFYIIFFFTGEYLLTHIIMLPSVCQRLCWSASEACLRLLRVVCRVVFT